MDYLRGATRGRGRGVTNSRGRGGGTRGQIGQNGNGDGQTRNSRGGIYSGGRGRGESGYKRGGRGRGSHAETSQQNPSGRDVRRGIGFGLIKIWSENTDTEDLLMQLCNKMESLEELMMSAKMREDWYSLLVQVINSAILCQHHTQKLKRLLKAVCTTHFLTQMLSNFLDQKQLWGMRWTGAEEFFNSIIKIIKQIVKHLPENAQNCKFALRILQMMMIDIEPVSENHDLEESIKTLVLVVTKVQNDRLERLKAAKSYQPCSDSETPPEDFRQLSVIPTVLDLSTDAKPFVRAIIIQGVYRDQEHYLDILFRLMREDFVKPLRSGIQEYREHINDKKCKNSHIRLYHDVHFTGMTHVNGINHVIQFDVSNMKHVKWDHSKRLLNGNLLCLSNDNFQSTLIFATVSFRDTSLLKKGIINIVCHSGLNIVLKASSSDSFVMAETMAYYEAVHPILSGLQSIDSDLPLKEYIISCQKQLKPPTYLLKAIRKYNLSCMMKTPRSTEVSVLNPLSWPSSESMCLNPCQREAAILALTKEISVIQGPPGTGKTYVGLKVMQVLLENQDRMLPNEISEHDPILVICYTNHALDQFLEGILGFCPNGIVRVGGKSSSTILEPFNLANVKKNKKTDSKAWKHSLWTLRNDLGSHMSEIDNVKGQVETLATDILKEDILIDCISPEHYNSLHSSQPDGKKKKSKIHQWLNASNKSLLEALPVLIKQHTTKLVMQTLHIRGRKNQVNFDLNATIVDRVNIYGFWLSLYQSRLRMEREAQQDINSRKYLDSLYGLSQRLSFLNDNEIGNVIHPDIFQQIFDVVHKSVDEPDENSIIEAWVLGLHHELNKQLDGVEELNCFIEKSIERKEENDDFDDKEESERAKHHRQIFEEGNDEMKNLKATLQVKNGGLFLLTRAKLLGINEDVDEEGSERNDSQVDSDGFTLVTRKKPVNFSQVRKFLSDDKFLPVTEDEEESIDDVWSLTMPKRFSLYKLWIKRYKDMLINTIEELIQKYNDTKQELAETRMKEDIDVLRQAKVIGMTTTGAAKKRVWLEAVGCRIIIVEEAAEVLEAHIVTALNKNCKHLILIGDHQQLRPSPTVYEHAKTFGLDVSLFERLVKNGVPHVTLGEQHRMRESISVVMRHIYPNLQDHISVKKYEDIRGVSKNIFFIQHNEDEETVKDTMSKSNPFEAEYLIRLCNYFLLQGYEPSQITVLATYAGQVLTLKKEMRKQNVKPGFRITAVDNFQGEENDIILLSLVRSNQQNVAGFLKVDNRVCVALSRAKKGMFAIGNIALLATQSGLWKKIKETAEKEGIIGEGLPVSCPNHPDEKSVMRVSKDFDRRPEGGCQKKCDSRLDCGHMCYLPCHGYNLEHKDFKCQGMCKNKCKEGHLCRKKCWQKCGDCTVPVRRLITSCGHTNEYDCNVTPKETDCNSQCEKVLPCGHRCTGKCGDCKKNMFHKRCKVHVTYFWPCDHAVEVPCHFKPSENPCPKPCGEILQCGHKCPGKCSDCLGGAVHMSCKEKCRNILFCGHICQSVCSIPCPPCSLPCPVACEHGPCNHHNKKRTCGQSCTPCQEPCLNDCLHRKCTLRCHEKCDVQPCEKLCQKVIGVCGHPCAGLCGEACVCRDCDHLSRIGKHVTIPEETDQQNLKSAILLKLASCSHVFELKQIDRYVKDEDRKHSTEFIMCPVCSVPIQKCRRYETIYKERAHRTEQEKKRLPAIHQMASTLKWNIRESLRLLFDTDTDLKWFDWRHLENTDLKTAGEIVAMSAKLKLAYVICEILSLNPEAASSEDGDGYDVQKRISALLKVKKTMSFQQIEEYKIDLKRILLCRYSDVLNKMSENNNVSFAEDTRKNWTLIWKELKKPKLSNSFVERGVVVINSMEHALMSKCDNSELQAMLLIKMKVVKRIFNVLKADNDMMLNEILEPTPQGGGAISIGSAASKSKRISSTALMKIGTTSTTTPTTDIEPKPEPQGGATSRGSTEPLGKSSTSTKTGSKRHLLDNFLDKMGFSSSSKEPK